MAFGGTREALIAGPFLHAFRMPDETKSAVPPEEGIGAEAASPATSPSPEPAEDWATRYKYLFADFENYRRRSERDREAISRQSRAGMIRELLPILEAFRAAKDAVARLPPEDPVRRGMDLLDREWSTFLKHEGVEPVAKVGAPFRPDEAEAVGEAPLPEGVPGGSVVEVVQQGYRFYGGLVRPAKVIVGRAPARPASPTAAVAEDPE